MSVYIKKLHIKNFKCFKEVSIDFNPNFNLIIGGNNSGKSTSFDALRLWQLAFVKFLKDRTNNKHSSFRVHQYYSFTLEDISFLRVTQFEKLTFDKNNIKFEISITLCGSGQSVNLPIIFTRTNEGQILRFELCKSKKERHDASDLLIDVLNVIKGTDFKTTLLFTYINPIFNIPLHEPHYSKGYIIRSLHMARVNKVIRNLLHEHAPLKKQKVSNPNRKLKGQKLIDIEKDLHSIVSSSDKKNSALEFISQLEDEDMYISLFAKDVNNNIEVELSQLGSGTLNLLNILSVLAFGDFEKFKLNALLLDEPDSHLHANHQKRLFKYLDSKSKEKDKQIFIITHNHELIECFDEVLFLDSEYMKSNHSIKAIPRDRYYSVYKEIAPDYHCKMLEIATKQDIEKELKSLKKATIYCEGTSDVEILKSAFSKLYGKSGFFDNKLDIFGGNGEGEVGNKLIHSLNNDIIVIGLLDNDFAGQGKKNTLTKQYLFKPVSGSNIHYQKEISENNNSKTIMTQTHLLLLPIPKFRLDKAKYFEKNLCIEYMFSDNVLKNKLHVELETEKGTTFKKIKTESTDKNTNSMCPIEKKKVTKNISKLAPCDFDNFIPLFKEIASIINYTLPIKND